MKGKHRDQSPGRSEQSSPSCLPPGIATSISGLLGRMDSKVARKKDTGDSTATYDDVQTRLRRDGPESIRDYCPEGPGEAGSGQRRLQS